MINSKYSVEEIGEAARFVVTAAPEDLAKAYGPGAASADIFVDLTWDEIVEKYRAYMASIGQFRAGNEVRFANDKQCYEPMVVTASNKTGNSILYTCLTKRGKFYQVYHNELVRTGRDYPQIREVLEIMNGKATPEKRKGPLEPAKLGIYQHFKGERYEVIANGFLEKHWKSVVIYKSLASGIVWVRSLENWSETVEVLDESGIYSEVPRFKYLGARV